MIDDFVLIDMVRDHEELYNRDHPEYLNQLLRDNTWREIAEKLGENSAVCKEKWHRIRENFRKALVLRSKKMESGTKIRPPKYFRQLNFLIPHISDDNNISVGFETSTGDGNGDNDDDQSDSSLSNPPRKSIKRSHSANELATEEVMVFEDTQNQTNTGTDPVLTEFFVNMANTVAKFPLSKQLEIKGKLFTMVHAAEMELASGGKCPFS